MSAGRNPIRPNFAHRIVIVALLLAFGGCAGRVFRQPVVTLERVQLAGLGLRGGTLMVSVQIQNPNPFTLTANEVEYTVEIADVRSAADTTWVDLAAGTYPHRFSVPGGDVVSVEVPVEFSYTGIGGAASSLLRAGAFTYRAAGVVDVATPLGPYALPFQQRGTVSLLDSR